MIEFPRHEKILLLRNVNCFFFMLRISLENKTLGDNSLGDLFIFYIICEMIHTNEIEPNRTHF